jgi:nitroreductase
LPDVAVDHILQAGRVAGSGKNRQGRRFVVLRDTQA